MYTVSFVPYQQPVTYVVKVEQKELNECRTGVIATSLVVVEVSRLKIQFV